MFIKREPHKIAKLVEQRYRLIWALSLEDQMVDRWLFLSWISAEIRAYDKVSSKTGWSAIPAGYRLYERTFRGKVLTTDASSWDWFFPPWLFHWIWEAKKGLLVDPSEDYLRAVEMRMRELYGDRCLVRLPTGQLLRQLDWGIMKSGSLLTLSHNSAGEFGVYSCAYRQLGLTMGELWCMGDDTELEMLGETEDEIKQVMDVVSSYGVKVKHYSHEREFAGFQFPREGVVRPAYEAKHKFLLNSSENPQELIDSYALLYALSDTDFSQWIRDRQSYAPSLIRAWARGLIPLDAFESC